MTTDTDIEAALACGDIEAACLLAASLPRPQAYLVAMKRINSIINEAKVRKPVIAIQNQAATLNKYTPFTEMHGDQPVQGAALHWTFNTDSAFLAGFNEELRAFFYHKHGARQHDLADQTAAAPDIRFPKLTPKYLWRQQYDNSTLTVHIGDRADNAVELSGKVKKPFSLVPMQGGTVVVSMTVHCHPSAVEIGAIHEMVRKEGLRISFEPGEEVEGDDDGEDE